MEEVDGRSLRAGGLGSSSALQRRGLPPNHQVARRQLTRGGRQLGVHSRGLAVESAPFQREIAVGGIEHRTAITVGALRSWCRRLNELPAGQTREQVADLLRNVMVMDIARRSSRPPRNVQELMGETVDIELAGSAGLHLKDDDVLCVDSQGLIERALVTEANEEVTIVLNRWLADNFDPDTPESRQDNAAA